MGKFITQLMCVFALTFLFPGFTISPGWPNHHKSWRFSFSAPAHASNYACEWPPQDEPDNDGDECNPTFLQNLKQAKNLGGKNSCDCNIAPTKAGDPIDYTIGNEFESEVDYQSGGPFPLVLSRFYNSADTSVVHEFGAKWHGSYSRSITATSAAATITRDDGRVFVFTLTKGVWTPDADVNSKLTKTASGWIYVTGLDETETYNASGHLTAFTNRAGLTQTLVYDGQGRLSSVTDPFGRALTFSYASAG